MKWMLMGLIRVYALAVRPALSIFGRCRHYPSCSDYARESIRLHGAWTGGVRSFLRLLRCHPLSDGGVDMP